MSCVVIDFVKLILTTKLIMYFTRLIGDVEKADKLEKITVFETKQVRTGMKRKREEKGDPGDVDGYKGPWRSYVDQVMVAKPTEEEKAALEIMFADKQKKKEKTEEPTIEESSLLHGESTDRET